MYIDLITILVGLLILIIGLLIGVAFLTLMERKIQGYIQIRKGPNKLGYMGIVQPYSDAVKLFTKEQVYLNYSNYLLYYFSPTLSWMVCVLMLYMFNMITFNLGLLFFYVAQE